MERLYKALTWLAAIALVLGLVLAYLYANPAVNQFPPESTYGNSDGLVGAFFKALSFQARNIMFSLSNLLGDGSIVLAAALAWAQRRHAWLVALIMPALLTLAWPSFFTAWVNLSFRPSGIPESQIQTVNFIALSVPLIPIALTLIFALIRRKPTFAAKADDELGIVRSAL